MTVARYQFTVTDEAGNVVPAATVIVRREVGGAPLAVLYSDRAGAVPIANPTAADSDGFVAFHTIGGAYRIDATAGAFTRTWRYVAIGTAAERDFPDGFAIDVNGDVTGVRNVTVTGSISGVINLTQTGYLDISEISTPAPPAANFARLFAYDQAGNTKLAFKDNAGVVKDLTGDAEIIFVIDGGGTTITTGVKGDLEIPFDCFINRATLLADQSGSIVVDIWKDTYANFPPVVGDKITASAPPTLSAAAKSQDATLTGWTRTITAGDILRFNVNSITTCTRVTVALQVTRRS